jgi:hypothetical protein
VRARAEPAVTSKAAVELRKERRDNRAGNVSITDFLSSCTASVAEPTDDTSQITKVKFVATNFLSVRFCRIMTVLLLKNMLASLIATVRQPLRMLLRGNIIRVVVAASVWIKNQRRA